MRALPGLRLSGVADQEGDGADAGARPKVHRRGAAAHTASRRHRPDLDAPFGRHRRPGAGRPPPAGRQLAPHPRPPPRPQASGRLRSEGSVARATALPHARGASIRSLPNKLSIPSSAQPFHGRLVIQQAMRADEPGCDSVRRRDDSVERGQNVWEDRVRATGARELKGWEGPASCLHRQAEQPTTLHQVVHGLPRLDPQQFLNLPAIQHGPEMPVPDGTSRYQERSATPKPLWVIQFDLKSREPEFFERLLECSGGGSDGLRHRDHAPAVSWAMKLRNHPGEVSSVPGQSSHELDTLDLTHLTFYTTV